MPQVQEEEAPPPVRRGGGLVFKGSGFYQTDYRSESYKKAAAADKPASESTAATSGKKSGSKTESKAESKPAAKSESKPAKSDSGPNLAVGDFACALTCRRFYTASLRGSGSRDFGDLAERAARRRAMDRRQFLAGSALAVGRSLGRGESPGREPDSQTFSQVPPTHSVIPVVGDGKWIWTEPPKDQTGYLEPRSFELSIGVELQGEGNATQIRASTPVPIEHAEQQIDDVQIETEGCQATVAERSAKEPRSSLLAAPASSAVRRSAPSPAIA